MTIFFFLVGLEIKREMTIGELVSLRKAALPVLAAIGGMILPAGIYLFLNSGEPASRGWGIPMATDIAFSLGVLALLGPRVPVALKVFLSAFAIVDDIGAVLAIALFYTSYISLLALGLAFLLIVILFILNRLNIESIWLYIFLGLCLWVCVLKSGVHATIAGVLLAMFFPSSKMEKLEHVLHPWVAYVIIPIFAFANAGVSMKGASLSLITHPIFLGIVVGLIIGKQFGVFLSSLIGVKMGMASLPQEVSWKQIYGAGWLGGIGFTMSIFVSNLAFEDNDLLAISKLAILCASVISAVVGWILLRIFKNTTK
jgi:Na+:H+ antiporter, NhaA family